MLLTPALSGGRARQNTEKPYLGKKKETNKERPEKGQTL